MSIGSLTLDFLHSRYKCTTVLLTKISPVAALPGNPKRPTLMKASFQRADLFVFTDLVGDLFLPCAVLFTDAILRKNINTEKSLLSGKSSGRLL